MRSLLVRSGLTMAFAALLALTARAEAQAPAPPPSHADSLLDRLVGRWTMTGTVRGHPVVYRLDVARVLRRRYVELHMEDVQRPSTYEARVVIGVDTTGNGYIAHWMDNFGASYSVPPATGDAAGDTIRLVFAYPDGPFHDTFVYDRKTDRWHFRLEATDPTGGPKPFAEYQVTRRR
jgi:hypothetical protein